MKSVLSTILKTINLKIYYLETQRGMVDYFFSNNHMFRTIEPFISIIDKVKLEIIEGPVD